MSRTKHSSLLAAPLAFCIGVGCSTTGGQTGEETQEPCKETKVALGLDEVSPLGFSASELLATVGGASTAALVWQSTSDLRYGPESGNSSIVFTVEGVVGASYIESEARPSEQLAMPLCEDRVEVTISATATTTGGAIAEAFQVKLSATKAQDVWLTQLFEPAELSGSFSIEPSSLGPRAFIRLALDAHWSTTGFSGLIAIGLEENRGTSPDSTSSFSMIPVACFSSSATPDQAAGCTALR